MSRFIKKIEKELMIISYKGDFSKDDVVNEHNKEMEKYKEDGWDANIEKIIIFEDGLTELIITLKKDGDVVLYKD